MSADKETLAVYGAQVAKYVDVADTKTARATLDRFLADVPADGHILDLGCGPGHMAAKMMRRGYRVDAVDATPEMVAEARDRFGVDARVARFDEIEAEAEYDGVWASFSLLHAPRSEMPGHLTRLKRALVDGGRLGLGLKTGTGEARDRIGRFYTYYTEDELEDLVADAGFTITGRDTGADVGLSGEVSEWVFIYAHA